MSALGRAFPAEHTHVADLPYRLSSWAFDYPENVGLWVDAEGKLAGWNAGYKIHQPGKTSCGPA